MQIHIRQIVAKRRELGWSQEQLARKLQVLGFDVSQAGISKIEREERRLTPDDLRIFAVALGVDPNWLLNWPHR